MENEKTLILLKPDALERALVGRILTRFEERRYKIAAMQLMHMTPDMAKVHYSHLADRDFFPEIRDYMCRGPLVALVLEGRDTVAVCRAMLGVTDGAKAAPGTIRGDFTQSFRENLVHASDSPEAAAREIKFFFPEFVDK
ncbi:MAG: nucleoside-diphosphate kinase [Planctomycetia bacterium]|nr:nucleoside-diphosphate kinase [Planctomycetia bacterium]